MKINGFATMPTYDRKKRKKGQAKTKNPEWQKTEYERI